MRNLASTISPLGPKVVAVIGALSGAVWIYGLAANDDHGTFNKYLVGALGLFLVAAVWDNLELRHKLNESQASAGNPLVDRMRGHASEMRALIREIPDDFMYKRQEATEFQAAFGRIEGSVASDLRRSAGDLLPEWQAGPQDYSKPLALGTPEHSKKTCEWAANKLDEIAAEIAKRG